ncbi:MAG: hypothetical protein ABSG21_02655 [Spirochaetia bacterium]|jgi:hypothetical protein
MKVIAHFAGIAILAGLTVPAFAQNTGQAIPLMSGGKASASCGRSFFKRMM